MYSASTFFFPCSGFFFSAWFYRASFWPAASCHLPLSYIEHLVNARSLAGRPDQSGFELELA